MRVMMRVVLRGLALALALTMSHVALADGHFERTLSVSAQPDVYISTNSGNITVYAGSDNQIHIAGHIRAEWNLWGSGSEAGSAIKAVEQNPPIVQEGNTIRVGPLTGQNNRVSIDYEITAPVNAALNLRSGSGDVKVIELGRFLTASSGSGNLDVHGLHGPADLSTGSGNIVAELSGAGDVKAKAGSGNIRIHNLNGTLIAKAGSGDIEADGHLTGAATLLAGSGNVRLRLGQDAHFNLEAATGSGNIHVKYPGAPQQDDHSRHHLTGPVNGGGAAVEVRTGSGDIEIGT